MTLRIRRLSVHYAVGPDTIRAVDGIDLDIRAGRILGIVGESGSGKSTLALSILRLIEPPGKITNGEIYYDDTNLLKLRESEMQLVRGSKIGLVLQNPASALSPTMTVGQHLVEVIQERLRISRQDAAARSIDILHRVHLPDQKDLLRKYPHQLSGGMMQRVLVALAMVSEPAVLIADEPTSALDVATQAQILKLLRELNELYGTTIVLITHNLGVAAEVCDDIAVMYAGRVMEVGDVYTLFDRPAHPYTQGLVKAVPKADEEGFPSGIRGDLTVQSRPLEGCVFCPRCDWAMEICRTEDPPAFEWSGTGKAYCFLYAEGPKNG